MISTCIGEELKKSAMASWEAKFQKSGFLGIVLVQKLKVKKTKLFGSILASWRKNWHPEITNQEAKLILPPLASRRERKTIGIQNF